MRALDGVSFRVEKGEIVGFLGPNGAGKTTALRILCGYLAPDAGTVRVDGVDVVAAPREAQARIGYLPENAPLYGEMRVADYLVFRARLKGVRDARGAAEAAMGRLGVAEVARRRIGELSKGWKQRVGVCDALVARPPVLVLDEPTSGLDPAQIRELRELIRELGRDHTVLVSSHILPEIEAIASRVVILVGGRVVGEDRFAALRAAAAERVVIVVAPEQVAAAVAAVAPMVADVVDAASGRLRVTGEAPEVAKKLVAAGVELRELRRDERTLEDLFVEVTR